MAGMMISTLDPSQYDDWREWARATNKMIEAEWNKLSQQKTRLDTYILDANKPRGGYPAGAQGDLILIKATKNDLPEIKTFDLGTWKGL